jgi:hypothetical protein
MSESRLGYKFAAIPEWVLFDVRLQAVDVRVFGALARAVGRKGDAWPGIDRIGERVGISPATVRRSLKRLGAVGAVFVEARFAPDGRQTSNLYCLAGDSPLAGGRVSPVTGGEGVTAAREEAVTADTRMRLKKERDLKPSPRDAVAPVRGGRGVPPGGAGEPTPDQEQSRQKLVALYVDQARLNGYDPTGRVKGHVASQLKRLLEKDHKPFPVLRMALIAVAKEGKPIGNLDYVVADAERSLNGHGKEASNGQVR